MPFPVLSTFGIGILGPLLFGLGLGDSMLVVLFANVLTACLPAFMAVFGPKLGLRQMTSTRFSWGWYGAKLVALLNCIACVGWSTINTIAGAQVLTVVADESIVGAAPPVHHHTFNPATCSPRLSASSSSPSAPS